MQTSNKTDSANSTTSSVDSRQVRIWFSWFALTTVMHVAEQLVFGMGEPDEVCEMLTSFAGLFSLPHHNFIMLLGLASVVAHFGIQAIRRRENCHLLLVGSFGIAAIGEMHHIIRTVIQGAYCRGAVSAVFMVTVGILMVVFAVRQSPDAIAFSHRCPTCSRRLNAE